VLLSALTSFNLCSLQLHFSAFLPIMFVAVVQAVGDCSHVRDGPRWAYSFCYSFSKHSIHYIRAANIRLVYKRQWRNSKHFLALGPKCLMHFSAEVSETFRHWCGSVHWTLRHQRKNLRHFGTKHMVPKCLGSEVS